MVTDDVGDAHGTIIGGATLADTGNLELDGVDDYVQLPDGLLAGFDGATFMVWATWGGSQCWERLFDFGNNVVVGGRLEADTSFFMTPHFCATEPRPAIRLEFRTSFVAEGAPYARSTAAGPALPSAPERHHYAATVDPDAGRMTLYIDGAAVGNAPLADADTGAPLSLTEVRAIDNWLGRSQYLADAFFVGSFDEFRLYALPLGAAQIQAAFEAGPDTVLDVE